MARTMQTRKRSGGFLRPLAKRSRPIPRRRFKRRTSSGTTKSSYGNSFGYKGRKTSKKTYRRRLWIATTAKTKYRSIMSRLTIATAPTGGITQLNSAFNALKNFAGDPFWESAGGALDTEDGILPTFSGESIVLRGGMIKLICNNDNSNVEPVRVRVWLYHNHSDFSAGNWTGTFTAGFDPTMTLQPSKNLGRLKMYKEFLIENNNMGEVSYRVPMMEINSVNYLSDLQGYFWLTAVHAPGGNASNVTIVNSFNLSFVGDVI